MGSTILLVNPNCMRPPIGPLGLEFVAASLRSHGYEPVLCDLTFSQDWASELDRVIDDADPEAVGVSVRNIDDTYLAGQDFILARTADMIRHIMKVGSAPVILGGVGFSTAPREILEYTGADYGIYGDGEGAFEVLLTCLSEGEDVGEVPGAVYRSPDGTIVLVPPVFQDLYGVPASSRSFADNPRYFAEGGQAGVETKRGCDQHCIYCVEPHAKGDRIRLRPPETVAREFSGLLDQGIDVFHLCDSEFNLPPEHAQAICGALIEQRLASEIRWYTYASPVPFDDYLAKLMSNAGCVGINFGVDHAVSPMLSSLRRNHRPESLKHAVEACKNADVTVMFDMLLGGPGETKDSIRETVDLLRDIQPDCVGLSSGIRVFPHTPLARLVKSQGPMVDNPNLLGTKKRNENLLLPVYYVDEGVDGDILEFVWSLVGDDDLFLVANPHDAVDRNYNYNDNSVLSQAIQSGERGAYWDILRSKKA
jgi:radical SAM superfamily enzyme YgiQ (UPF0313 family)